MPVGLLNTEWLNSNMGRRYPLSDLADGIDQTGTFTLPTDFLVELDLPVYAGADVDPARFFLMHLGVFATGYNLVVGYQPLVGDPVPAASALISRSTWSQYAPYNLNGTAPFDDTAGKLVLGRLDNIDQQPAGYFTFDFEHGRLDADVIRPLLRGITRMSVLNGTEESAPFYGDVVLVAGSGMVLSAATVGGATEITFTASADANFNDTCECTDVPDTPCIRFLNDLPPDSNGNFNLLGSQCVTIEAAGEHALIIRNPCTEPCATCSDLEAITRDLDRLFEQAATLEAMAQQLLAQSTIFSSTVLGARLSDRGCPPESECP